MSTQQHPAAWAVFADNGNVRLWSTDHAEVRAFAEAFGQPLIALYPGPPAQPAPHDDPIGNACRLLREAAQEYAEGVSVNGVPDWKNEPDTHSAYIEHITAAHRLEQWAASIGAGGVEPLRKRPRQIEHDHFRDATKMVIAQSAPAAVAGPKEAVAYLDIGEGGYLDLGSDLSDEALRKLPKGRHMLAIVGTYSVDGYVPVAAPTTQAARPAYAEMPDAPLPVFSKGPWTFKETGQNFSGAELDEAAFVAYRGRAAHGQAPVAQGDAEDAARWRVINEQFIDDYLEDYELIGEAEGVGDCCYTPTETERVLIKDAVLGLLSCAEDAARAQAKEGGAA